MKKLLLFVIIFAQTFVGAAESCTFYTIAAVNFGSTTVGPITRTSPILACVAFASAASGAAEFGTSTSQTRYTGAYLVQFGDFCYLYQQTRSRVGSDQPWGEWSSATLSASGWRALSDGTGVCPPDPCEAAAALASPNLTAGARPAPSGQLCSSDDGQGHGFSGGDYGYGCEVVKVGAGMTSPDSGHWFGGIRYTGQSCTGTPDATPNSTANCVATASGAVCVDKSAKNCGSFNGERVCLDTIPAGNCTILASGGAVCESSAGDVPRDEMNNPMAPVASMQSTDEENVETTYNYYSSTQVSSSSSVVVAGGNATPQTPGSGSGLPGGEEGNGDGDYGDLPGEGFGFGLEGVPIYDAMAAVFVMPDAGGSCPSQVITIPVVDVEWDGYAAICELWPSVASVIHAASLLSFIILGAIIILRA